MLLKGKEKRFSHSVQCCTEFAHAVQTPKRQTTTHLLQSLYILFSGSFFFFFKAEKSLKHLNQRGNTKPRISDNCDYNLSILKGKKRESSYFSIFFQKQTPNYKLKLLLNMY